LLPLLLRLIAGNYGVEMEHNTILEHLHACADAVQGAYASEQGRGYSGQRATQYHLDLAADAAALQVLTRAGFRVLSEESGLSGSGQLTAVLDPIDGSTNCDRSIPFFATSIAVLDNDGLVAGLVVNQSSGVRYWATRGGGAWRDGERIGTSGQVEVAGALVSFSGLPERNIGWGQIRALGAASLEFCLVADGSLDLYTVAQRSTLNPWDYLAGMLIAQEAGAFVGDYNGEDLIIDQAVVRRPLVAATQELGLEFMSHGPL
jgi:fructose-1,6-bisphosphatase/inositol monophosphatase family enzyme